MSPRRFSLLILVALAACVACAGCAAPQPAPPAIPLATATPAYDPAINLDAETQRLIAGAERVAFIVPFSHWDTDWHEAFPDYVKRSDGNILNAIQMAGADPRFRYTMEQVYFVQHFWQAFPEHRAALKAAVERGQLTFAWAGLTQPETSLVAPSIQVRNLQMGRQWIADTFGPEFLPQTAWQSDAFGNSAAFPIFLTDSGIPYLFIGRWQHRCDPDYQDCQPLPHLFYWRSPAAEARILTAYLSYPNAWDAIHRLPDEGEQVKALRDYVESQFARAESKYAFIPMGSDFIDPLPNVMSLVDRWNAEDKKTALVVADPMTAFQYIETQSPPEFDVDLNPIWQAFYGTRPYAKIADKESDYYLTANDKFGMITSGTPSTAWVTAAVNTHYDNIGAVSFDRVWAQTQRPRFEETVSTAANDLAGTLARIASGVEAPLIVFNPTSWARSEIVEISGDLPDLNAAPYVQYLSPDHVAVRADSVPAVGWTGEAAAFSQPHTLPAQVISRPDGTLVMKNYLVSLTIDPAHGGTFSSMSFGGGGELLKTFGDDVTYWADDGDVYGARFGDEIARESQTTAQAEVLASGPLVARVQINFSLGGYPVTKTVTLRADSPLIEVMLEMRAYPESSILVHTPTTLAAETRTDDLGFTAFSHAFDNRPIAPGDITYRRKIFYPITYWSDLSTAEGGLALITHGLQGVGGMGTFNLLLGRSVTHDAEGVTDTDYHTFHYAYFPHFPMTAEELAQTAYAFNQPLIPVWRANDQIHIHLPFSSRKTLTPGSNSNFPTTFSLLSAESALVLDLYENEAGTQAVIVDYDPATPATLNVNGQTISLPAEALSILPVKLK
jgi:hypothetical protein